MPDLSDLPAEILEYTTLSGLSEPVADAKCSVLAELLVKEKQDDLRWDQFPLDSYAEDVHSSTPSRALVNLAQVNVRFRHHFQAVLWRDITIYYVSDIEKLDRFLDQPPGLTYGKYVRNVMLSWWDDIVGNEFQAEADISEYEEVDLGLGSRDEWIFKDRIVWWYDIWKSQLREQHPDWTEQRVEQIASEPLPYPYTSGPDGRGPVPNMSSTHDVEEALMRIFDRLCFVKHVDWNSRLLSLPAWLPHRLHKLQSLVLLHEDFRVDNCTALLDCCRHVQYLTMLDFKDDLGAFREVTIQYPALRFCSPSEASPLGIKLEDNDTSDRGQPLHIICQSLLEGVRCKLHMLTLDDGNLLRVERLLPAFLSLELVSCLRDEQIAQHHWDWAVESSPAPFAALRDLRERLSTSENVQDLLARCADILHGSRSKESLPGVANDTLSSVLQPKVEDFASWLVHDSLLAERTYLALGQRRNRSQAGR